MNIQYNQKNDYNLYNECYVGRIEIVKLIIEKGDKYWDLNLCLYNACRGGHIEIVKLMIEEGATDWDGGLDNACDGGHMEIVKFMIKKGANDWNGGIYYACFRGLMDIVKLMIEKGADNWNWGLINACKGGNMEIVKLMIEKGATNLECLHDTGKLSIYKLYIKKTGKCDRKHYEKLVIEQDPLYTIITHYDNNEHIKKLPFELWRMTKEFI